MTKTVVERLVDKMKRELGVICDPKSFHRTYAGYWQRRAGAYVWTMKITGSDLEIGSCDPASLCVKKEYTLFLKNGEIFAEIRSPQ